MEIRGMVEYVPLTQISYECKRISCRIQKSLRPGNDLIIPGKLFMQTTCVSSEIAYFSEEDFNTVVNSNKNTDENFDVITALCDYLLDRNCIPKDSLVQNVIVLDKPQIGCQLTLE